LTAINLTNKTALYNFLSTFSGTHFVTPRAYTAELGFHFYLDELEAGSGPPRLQRRSLLHFLMLTTWERAVRLEAGCR
jgi:hypothetical protein